MEREVERYYTDFRRPPFAPTFWPSEEEFIDPISYVAKIRSEAENFGIIKIVPPKSFCPPFCIEPSNFEFTPRVQRLIELDALFRLRIIYINKLVKFWQIQGRQFRLPWFDDKYIDLYRLRQLVSEEGGVKNVNERRKWSQFAKILGLRPNAGPSLKHHYVKWIHPFELNISLDDDDSASNDSTQIIKRENKGLNVSPLTRSQTRMMAGTSKQRINSIPSLDKSSLQNHRMSIEMVVCSKCGKGNNESRLLLCETCDGSLHTYCATPPLPAVPRGEWRCSKCLANVVKSISTDFGFMDSNQRFNLNTFGEWANSFKQQYFKQSHHAVSSDEVETEYWRNVIDIDKSIQVKYGADLISSSVGSGFPRKEDCSSSSINAYNKEQLQYANHPWNLNNLPKLRESVLCHMDTDISGMMVPWVYVGMLFSTFCWHVEDHWTYSINYNHWGEPKIWYGIPGDEAENFERVMRTSAPELFQQQSDLLHHMTTALNPRYLMDHGISVYTIQQNSGEFVITFPRSYHAGFNEGLNFAEAVNFAPPDWLRMGRYCLENYANVGRTCVFSHEELVMKMVLVSTKMSINMCLKTLEELTYIVANETDFRKKLTEAGLRDSKFCKFEDIPDDDRTCAFCRTTIFCSGLVCRHEGRIVCMQHLDKLCHECRITDCCLKFRHTLEDLIPLVKHMTERTNSFFEWKNVVTELCSTVKEIQNDRGLLKEGKQKIDAQKMRTLADHWKKQHFPNCDEICYINKLLDDFTRISLPIRRVLDKKPRLREQTRCQKADTRFDYSEFCKMRQQYVESIFQDNELETDLNELYEKVESWKDRTEKLLFNSDIKFAAHSLLDLMTEANEFTIKLETEGLYQMKPELSRIQWLDKAIRIIEMKNAIDKETQQEVSSRNKPNLIYEDNDDLEARNDKRFDLQEIRSLLTESSKWSHNFPLIKSIIHQLQTIYDSGTALDRVVKDFLLNAEGIGLETARNFWQKNLLGNFWIYSNAINIFREELQVAFQIDVDFNSISDAEFSLRKLELLNQQFLNSLFERSGSKHKQVIQLKNSLSLFVERIRTIFQKTISYYNVFDIIAGRSDLPSLVEGETEELTLFSSSKYNENWKQLRMFDTKEKLLTHLNAISEQQNTLLHALRLGNEKRPLRETCSCGLGEEKREARTKIADSLDKSCSFASTSIEVIPCFICNAAFHGNCAQWDLFMERLPSGVYLCPRCLRSRRPCIEDVEMSIACAPKGSLERILVQEIVERSTSIFSQLKQLLHSIPKGIKFELLDKTLQLSIKESLRNALVLEVTEADFYKILTSISIVDFFQIPAQHISIWQKMKGRLVTAEASTVIFSSPIPSSSSIDELYYDGKKRISGMKRRGYILSTAKQKHADELSEKKQANNDNNLKKEESDCFGVRKMKRSDGSNESEKCAADLCLNPYSEKTRWIMCEAGCSKWYHFCCVGISIRGAQSITSYCCYKCTKSQNE